MALYMKLYLLFFLSCPLNRFCMFEFLGADVLFHFNIFAAVLKSWMQCWARQWEIAQKVLGEILLSVPLNIFILSLRAPTATLEWGLGLQGCWLGSGPRKMIHSPLDPPKLSWGAELHTSTCLQHPGAPCALPSPTLSQCQTPYFHFSGSLYKQIPFPACPSSSSPCLHLLSWPSSISIHPLPPAPLCSPHMPACKLFSCCLCAWISLLKPYPGMHLLSLSPTLTHLHKTNFKET